MHEQTHIQKQPKLTHTQKHNNKKDVTQTANPPNKKTQTNTHTNTNYKQIGCVKTQTRTYINKKEMENYTHKTKQNKLNVYI